MEGKKGSYRIQDDFQDGDSAGWTTLEGSFAVSDVDDDLAFKATSNDAIAVVGDSAWANYSVQGKMKAGNTAGGGMKLLGRVQSAGYYYQLELLANGQWKIHKNDNYKWIDLAGGTFEVVPETWYTLKLTLNGSTLTASVSYDEGRTWTTLGSVSDTLYGSGKPGVAAWGGMLPTFDNIQVEQL